MPNDIVEVGLHALALRADGFGRPGHTYSPRNSTAVRTVYLGNYHRLVSVTRDPPGPHRRYTVTIAAMLPPNPVTQETRPARLHFWMDPLA